VLVTQRLSNDALYGELLRNEDALHAEGIQGVYRIGDCLEPRFIAECIFDGHRLAREIDSEDPARPLSFIREHRVLGAKDDDYDRILAGHDVVASSSSLHARSHRSMR
jgi:dimethylamine/trimethylamine dehydrogenase